MHAEVKHSNGIFFEQEFLLCVNVEIAVSLLGLLQSKLVLILWFKPIIIIR